MPEEALSLLGFLDHETALRHLKYDCILDDASETHMTEIWETAQAHIGQPIASAGHPGILDFPEEFRSHIAQHVEPLARRTGMHDALGLSPPRYCLLEIAPLLAHQLNIRLPASDAHDGTINPTTSLTSLIDTCFPTSASKLPIETYVQGNSLVLKSSNLNLHLEPQWSAGGVASISIVRSQQFVTAVEMAGRCYLLDGYHRAYRLALSGITHIPCALRQSTRDDIHDQTLHRYFSKALFDSDHAPALGHFVTGRATRVKLRKMSRVLHVSWAEWVFPDE